MAESPYIIVKHREGGTFRRDITIVRYWKHKETGNVVEVRSVKNVVPENYLRVVFFDPLIKIEVSLPLKKDRPDPFDPTKIEKAFENDYEPYGNFSSRF